MLTCEFLGRMGNNMFQIASTIGIALDNNLKYGFKEWAYQKYFIHNLPTRDDVSYTRVTEKNFYYNKYIVPNHNYELYGYFQSSRYFILHNELIRNYFEFKSDIHEEINKKYKTLLLSGDSKKELVSLHIRRGDYLNIPDYHHNLLLDEYYYNAMGKFEKTKHIFLVFSDDIGWCEKQDWNGHNVEFIKGNNEGVDMCLMSKCHHHIIANSSFSWWGAYFCVHLNKKIFAPIKWFGKNNSASTKDLIPKEWHLI